MMKVTVLYGKPESHDDFEIYYGSTHLPLAGRMKDVARVELTKFVAAPDGGKPSFYRMAELYFTSQADMEKSLGSVEGQATIADIQNFATGGVTVLIGSVQG
ncbi:MAG: EthD family reductase [Desulforhopalus sp.]